MRRLKTVPFRTARYDCPMKTAVPTSLLTLLALPAIAVVAMACSTGGGSGDPPKSGPASSGPSAGPSDVPSNGAGGALELPPNDILQPVLADAAAQAGVQPADVVVVSAEAVQWSDGSLGCPQPGMMYTQALVDGFQIVVRAGTTELDYRVRGPGSFRICPKG